MKMCDRCRVPGCLLNYNGEACKKARKEQCPDVVLTNADKIREMSVEELAEIIMCPHETEPGLCNKSSCIECCREWLQEVAEVV